MKNYLTERIVKMNEMYNLKVNRVPVLEGDVVGRLISFKKILMDEVDEIDEIIILAENEVDDIEVLTAIADLLGDVEVYCRSEALKYGLPMDGVLDVIMDSNESKLGSDGCPIYDDNGKFLKGPGYWRPESKIKSLLSARINEK